MPFIPLDQVASPLLLPLLRRTSSSADTGEVAKGAVASPRDLSNGVRIRDAVGRTHCGDPSPEEEQIRCSTAASSSTAVVVSDRGGLVSRGGGEMLMRPIHGVSGIKWPSDAGLLGRPSKRSPSKPQLMTVMEHFLSKEMKQLDGGIENAPPTEILGVYKEVFRMFICAFESYAPVLERVEAAYDAAFDELRMLAARSSTECKQFERERRQYIESIGDLTKERDDLLVRLANQERRHQRELTTRCEELKQVTTLQDALKTAKKEREDIDKERIADGEKMLTLIRTARESENRVRTLDRELRKAKSQNELLLGIQKSLSATQLELRDFRERYKHKVPITQHESLKEALQSEIAAKDQQVRQMRRLCGMRSCEMGVLQRQYDLMRADLKFESETGRPRAATPRPDWDAIIASTPTLKEEITAVIRPHFVDDGTSLMDADVGPVPYPQAREIRSTRLIVEDMARRISELTEESQRVKRQLEEALEAQAAIASSNQLASLPSSPYAPPATLVAPIEGILHHHNHADLLQSGSVNVSVEQASETGGSAAEGGVVAPPSRRSFVGSKNLLQGSAQGSLPHLSLNRHNSTVSAAPSPMATPSGSVQYHLLPKAAGASLIKARGISVAVPPFLRAVGSIRCVPIPLEECRQLIIKLFHEYVRRNVDWKNPRCRVAYALGPFFEDVAAHAKGVLSGATLRLNSLGSQRGEKWEPCGASSGAVSLGYNVVAAAEDFKSKCPLCAWFLGVLDGTEPVHIIYDALSEYNSLRDQVSQLGDLQSKTRVKKAAVMESLGMVLYYKTMEELEELRLALGQENSVDIGAVSQLSHPFALTSFLQDIQQCMHLHRTIVNAVSQASRTHHLSRKSSTVTGPKEEEVSLVAVPTIAGGIGERRLPVGVEEGASDDDDRPPSSLSSSASEVDEDDELVVDGRVIVCGTLLNILNSVEPGLPKSVIEQLTTKHSSPSPCPPSGSIPIPVVMQRLESLPIRRYSRAKRPALPDSQQSSGGTRAPRLRRLSDGSAVVGVAHTASSSSATS